jgi:hypothetical protein
MSVAHPRAHRLIGIYPPRDAGGGTGSPVDAGSPRLRSALAGGSLAPVGTGVVFHLISKRPS